MTLVFPYVLGMGYDESYEATSRAGARMTVDERLIRLTERHEALTGHVEMLTSDISQLTADVKNMRSAMDDLMTGFTSLVELARSHERRIDRLESRQ